MKPTSVVLLSLVSGLCLESAFAETIGTQKAEKIVNITEMKGNVITGISEEALQKIVAGYVQQHKLDTEQIKALTDAITALSKGQGIIGTPSQIEAALDALAKGDTTQAKALFELETQRAERTIKQVEGVFKDGAKAYRNLGALAYLDNTQEALAAYKRATELDPDNADGWNRLGLLYKRTGELDQAIAAYQTVANLGQKHNDQQEIAAAYGNLGNVYRTRGELDKAVEMHSKALAINQALGNKEGMAQNYTNLGNVYYTRGELDKAVEMHSKALAIDEQMSNKQGMAQDYGNLGLVYQTRSELDKAVEMFQKSLAITESLDIKETSANQYANLGLVYKQKGNKGEAKRYWQKSIELYKYIGSPEWKDVQKWLDDLK